MNNEEPMMKQTQLTDVLLCRHLSDRACGKYHQSVLKIVSEAMKTETIVLPLNVYCQYKGYVKLMEKAYENMPPYSPSTVSNTDLNDIYHNYRGQVENCYDMLCKSLLSWHKKTTLPQEKERLKKLIDDLSLLIRQAADR